MRKVPLAVALVVLLSGCIGATPSGPTAALTLDGLVRQLGQHGLAVAVRETMPRDTYPFFSVSARRLVVNDDDVQLFEYAGDAVAAGEASRVSPSGTPIGSSQITWIAPPRFYRKERFIVLYIGSEITVARGLAAVLGEPFAGSK